MTNLCLRLDIFEFLSHVQDGLKDHYDIKMLTYLMVARLPSTVVYYYSLKTYQRHWAHYVLELSDKFNAGSHSCALVLFFKNLIGWLQPF